jgi:hypothetical protein
MKDVDFDADHANYTHNQVGDKSMICCAPDRQYVKRLLQNHTDGWYKYVVCKRCLHLVTYSLPLTTYLDSFDTNCLMEQSLDLGLLKTAQTTFARLSLLIWPIRRPESLRLRECIPPTGARLH